jgi:hypothetical protein
VGHPFTDKHFERRIGFLPLCWRTGPGCLLSIPVSNGAYDMRLTQVERAGGMALPLFPKRKGLCSGGTTADPKGSAPRSTRKLLPSWIKPTRQKRDGTGMGTIQERSEAVADVKGARPEPTGLGSSSSRVRNRQTRSASSPSERLVVFFYRAVFQERMVQVASTGGESVSLVDELHPASIVVSQEAICGSLMQPVHTFLDGLLPLSPCFLEWTRTIPRHFR